MKTTGMKHQLEGLERSDGMRNFGFLYEQGCGKTWTAAADAERCFEADKINALVVIAPNGVHSNWTRRELPQHLSIPFISHTWHGKPTTKKDVTSYNNLMNYKGDHLRVFSINVEALNFASGYDACEEFINENRPMIICDESTRIKNPGAKRTEKVIGLGRNGTARRILTGTPLTKAPTDLFSQFDFLKPGLLGTTSYRAFMAEYAVLLKADDPKMQAIMRKLAGKTRGIPQVVAEDANGNKLWRNLDKLAKLILPHSHRVRKDECLDLPQKVYQSIYFELGSKQRAVYEKLEEDYHYQTDDGEDMRFEAIATRTKMKQVTSGFINVYGEAVLIDPKENPRMAAFKEVLEDVEGQFIVWAMFQEEIDQILAALQEFGISHVEYTGRTGREARENAIDDFQAGRVRCFVGHAAAAGIGITLTAATVAIYYSCSFDNELRLQSEDRCHRIGTTKSVLYIDLVAEATIDEDIAKSLAMKNALAYRLIDQVRA